MRFQIAAAAAFVAGASAAMNGTYPVYTTEVVTAYTTYCPSPTSIVHGNQTYTVSEATTLTITNCPCTVTKPATSVPAVTSPVVPTPVVPIPVSSSIASPIYGDGTVGTTVAPIPTGGAVTTASVPATASTSKPIATYTGAANKAFAASGAGLAAIFGLAAYAL
ncbi:hypothetical protein LTR66_011434 [Elasticomyces elasticus]|nr:hypothetical protein LTR66_011434 [Elasticomyces elasticus]